jgi:ferrous iron transport protein A
MVPGTVLTIDLVGPAGDPVAYHVRGASIALRREQSDRILVRPQGMETT